MKQTTKNRSAKEYSLLPSNELSRSNQAATAHPFAQNYNPTTSPIGPAAPDLLEQPRNKNHFINIRFFHRHKKQKTTLPQSPSANLSYPSNKR